MVKRMVVTLLIVAALLTTIGFVKWKIQAAMAGGGYQPPPEAVTTVIAQQGDWPGTLEAIGTVTAVDGVTVSADLPGVVEKIAFTSGDRVNAGALLVRQDARQEQAQLAAATAKLDLARLNLERMRGLREQGINSPVDFDTAVAEEKQAQGVVAEIQSSIARKTIRAPFTGVLGIRQINLGQYLKSGDPIVPLQSVDPIYVNFDVPQHEILRVRPGAVVHVLAENLPDAEVEGKVSAVDSVINESTRNVLVQSMVRNPQGWLRPGMFVTARLLFDSKDPVVALPASSISYAPYGDSVFIVEEKKGPDGKASKVVRQQFVKLGGARGDQVAVTSGVPAGAEVVTSGVFKLRNGVTVAVNNAVQPSNNPEPSPEDN